MNDNIDQQGEGLDQAYTLLDSDGGGIDLTGRQVRVITYALTLLYSAGVTDNPLAALAAVDTAALLTEQTGLNPDDVAELGRELVTFHAPTLAAESAELAKSVALSEHAQYN